MQKLLLPQECDAAATGMMLQDLRQFSNMVRPGPIALPFRCHCQPGHHIRTGHNHALDGNVMRLN